MTAPVDVLVVGAGPTGLTTALQAHDHGATVRVVERRPDPFRPSRAMIMHPRTLESLRPLGVTEALLERGDRAPEAQLHLGRRCVSARLADLALPDTAFPHLTMIRQMDVEAVLAGSLRERGVEVERGVELLDVSDDGEAAHATLGSGGRVERAACRFVAGCDGPASTVRQLAGIGWRGGGYREEVVLADAELDGSLAPGVLHVVAGRRGLVFVFALGETAPWRILATRPGPDPGAPFGQPGATVPASEVQQILAAAGLPARLSDLRWSARVRLQHRLADSFREGRLFLAGDAAHAHSPAAAQGMNTGILDAVNLGWKLGFAADNGLGADDGFGRLLASYELERRPVARQVLALTHLVFFAEASTHPLPSFLRGTVVPHLAPAIPLLLARPALMAEVVRVLSQRWVRYRGSPLSVESTRGGPGPRPGDRLPDQVVTAGGRRVRLHELTARPGVHLLVRRDTVLSRRRSWGRHVTTHRLSSWPGHGLVAVRPDGHVGFRSGNGDTRDLDAWLRLVGAVP